MNRGSCLELAVFGLLFIIVSRASSVQKVGSANAYADDAVEHVAARLAASEAAAVAFAATKPVPVILTLGDSQTAYGSLAGGWVNQLSGAYGFSADVLSRSIVMGSTRGGKKFLETLIKPACPQSPGQQPFKLVTIFFGSNDGSPVMNNISRRMVPLEEYSQNLRDMVTMLKASGVQNILLITPPPRGQWDASVMEPYVDAMLAVAKEQQVAAANFFAAVVAVDNYVKEVLLPDRIHLTARGNQLVYDTVMSALESQLPAVLPPVLQHQAAELSQLPSFVEQGLN